MVLLIVIILLNTSECQYNISVIEQIIVLAWYLMFFWNRQYLCFKMIVKVGICTLYQKLVRVDFKNSKFMAVSPEYKSKHVAITVICSVPGSCSEFYKPCLHF
jgi:hypothetical protein